MNVWNWLRQTPLWLVVPSVFLAAGVATAIGHYEPLVFDPNLYEVRTADAAELETIDAEAIEAEHASAEPSVDVGLDAPAAAAASGAELADGSWTGYASCGKGNADNWKPYYVGVTVSVDGGKVSGVTDIFGSSTGNAGDAMLSWDAAENQKYLDWAVSGRNGAAGVRSQLVGNAVVSRVDTVSGATYSSAAIYNAYVDALKKAAAAVGGYAPVQNLAAQPVQPEKPTADKGKKPKKRKANEKVGTLADGTWDGFAACGVGNDEEWSPYYVKVSLKVSNGAVSKLSSIEGSSKGEKGDKALSYDEEENGVYLKWAIDGRTRSGVEYVGLKAQIGATIEKRETLTSIDTVSGATYSSDAIFRAYYNALKKSATAGGATIDEPEEESSDESHESGDHDGSADSGGSDDAGGGEAGGTHSSLPGADEDDHDADSAAVESARYASTGIPSIHGDYPNGTYRGQALCGLGNGDGWSPYYICVDVKVIEGVVAEIVDVFGDEAGAIDSRYVYDSRENGSYLNWAINGRGTKKGVRKLIQARLDAGKEIESIDTVSNATYSCRAIYQAFADAIENIPDDSSAEVNL